MAPTRYSPDLDHGRVKGDVGALMFGVEFGRYSMVRFDKVT